MDGEKAGESSSSSSSGGAETHNGSNARLEQRGGQRSRTFIAPPNALLPGRNDSHSAITTMRGEKGYTSFVRPKFVIRMYKCLVRYSLWWKGTA